MTQKSTDIPQHGKCEPIMTTCNGSPPLTTTRVAMDRSCAVVIPADIKPPCPLTFTPTNHSPYCSTITLHLSVLPHHFLIYRCHLALSPIHSSFSSFPTMVSTHGKNKLAHPAAPVMTTAAKRKAGIKTNPRPKRVTKDQTIAELRARLAAFENPGETAFSKEPLVHITKPLHLSWVPY